MGPLQCRADDLSSVLSASGRLRVLQWGRSRTERMTRSSRGTSSIWKRASMGPLQNGADDAIVTGERTLVHQIASMGPLQNGADDGGEYMDPGS